MGKLQVLPAQIANMIAAGEVVGRPASVVKELMENALDAGADNIQVIIGDSGRTLIQVIDNGSGMSGEDAMLCFERHATSKVASAEDLEKIVTFGFRGEALASIAAVAEVTLKTRRADDETGTQVVISSYGNQESSPCSTPKGTNIAVRNLFYNTPARRKFLKSDGVELKHIIEEFDKVALTRPDVAFSLRHNERDIQVLKKDKSLKFRIFNLLGPGVVGDLVDISTDTSIISISGYIGKPESARKTLGNQFFFVNGRYFRSPYLHKAVMNAYAQMIPEGVTPSYFLYLGVDPQTVDVNISPTKSEVKFENDSVIFQTIYACVREALGRNSFGASIDFDTEGAVQMPQLGQSFSEYRGSEIKPSTDFNPDYNPFNQSPQSSGFVTPGGEWSLPSDTPSHYGGITVREWSEHGKSSDYSALFEGTALPSPVHYLIFKDKYIATNVPSGMLFVNMRRASERILYERMLRSLKSDTAVIQNMLFPVQAQVGAEYIPVFEDNAELLARLGFEIAVFGHDSVSVSGVPQGYDTDEKSICDMVSGLGEILEDGSNSLPEVMQAQTARKLTEMDVAKFTCPSTQKEAEAMLDELFACENADLTPSGKRITCIMPIEDIDKKF